MDLNSSEQYIKAVQAEIEEAGLEFGYFHGYGVAVGCPRCGAPLGDLEQWTATDYLRDDEYAGVRCRRCRWEDGGEILYCPFATLGRCSTR
jgi:DNA-directed RNA polymerase subunit RPC12/RpoP